MLLAQSSFPAACGETHGEAILYQIEQTSLCNHGVQGEAEECSLKEAACGEPALNQTPGRNCSPRRASYTEAGCMARKAVHTEGCL